MMRIFLFLMMIVLGGLRLGAQINLNDLAVLQNLYNTTGGPTSWTEHWDFTPPVNALYGIRTDLDGRVTGIDLDGDPSFYYPGSGGNSIGLNGQIPNNLDQLTKLSYLSLGHNSLYGSIPSSIGNISHLYLLSLGGNQLTGVIPTTLGNLHDLEMLYLSYNQLGDATPQGGIPASLGNLTNLRYLYLGNNQLTGSIPSELGKLHNLIVMHIADNQLTGAIPSTGDWTPGCFPALTEFWVMNNQLNLPLPANIGGCFSSLHYFLVYNNHIPGQIPTSLGNLIHVKYFSLGQNELDGPVPQIWSGMTSAIDIVFDNNQLDGEIPDFSNLPSLDYIGFGNNTLDHDIPNLSNLPSLRQLRLNNNHLIGPLPNFSGLPALKVLNLNNNQLSGNIPAAIGNLSNINTLDAHNNQLSGCFPASLANLCGRNIDFFQNPNLPGGGDFPAFCTGANGAQVIIDGPSAVCSGASVTLSASPGFTSYAWSNGGGTSQTATFSNLTSATTFTVTVPSGGSCTGTAEKTVAVNANPMATITGNNGSNCIAGNTTTLTANPPPSGGYTYLWNTLAGATTRAISASVGTYIVTVTKTSTGCTSTATRILCIKPTVFISPVGTVTICSGQPIMLKALAGNDVTYAWSNGTIGAENLVSPTANTTYTVTAANGSNCLATKSVRVKTQACNATSGCAATSARISGEDGTWNDTETEAEDIFAEERTDGEGTLNNPDDLVKAYPNPASKYLVLDYAEQLGDIETLALYDLNGKKMLDVDVFSEGYTQVDVSGLPAGVYVLRINGTIAKRIVLAR